MTLEERALNNKIIREIKLIEQSELTLYNDDFIQDLNELSDESISQLAFELSLVNIPFSKTKSKQINAYGVSDSTEININGNILTTYSGDDKKMGVIDFLVITHNYDKREKIIKEYEEIKKLSVNPFEYRVMVVNNLDDYNKFVHGMRVRDIVFTDISQVSQEMYDILRTRLVR